MTAELSDSLKFDVRMTAAEFSDYEAMGDGEGRCCSICDGYGHGYPGAGPCPLENTMSDEDVAREDFEYRTLS